MVGVIVDIVLLTDHVQYSNERNIFNLIKLEGNEKKRREEKRKEKKRKEKKEKAQAKETRRRVKGKKIREGARINIVCLICWGFCDENTTKS